MLRKTIRQLLQMEEEGEASSEDVDQTIGQAIEDHAENQLEIFDLEFEVDVANDAPPSIILGAALAQILNTYYTDADTGIAEMSAVAGITPENLMDCFTGEMIPSVDACGMIAEHYLTSNSNDYQDFMAICQAAHEVADKSSYDSEYMKETEYSAVIPEVQELRAEFNALQIQNEVGMRMRHLEKQADNLLNQNILTPAERDSLLRSDAFKNDPDSVAVFCSFCAANDTEPSSYLDKVEFCLNWKAQCGPSGYGAFFNQMSEIPIENPETVQDAQFVNSYRTRNGYQ
ncbi:MAG: hypothetical protein HC836_38150 [Richelia sp. RM2_1_2]|nr:hypothetical protein [Richelia sp. RM2_1_2]